MSYQFNYQDLLSQLAKELGKVIRGKNTAIFLVINVLLSRGHLLIEDVPGVGKTTLAMALGKATGLSFKRAQFTPDVMASDITGFTMYNKEKNRFEYREGLAMTNILLADEINRTSPKTQSALLEAMEEKRVTVDGEVHLLPEPFMVIATQNSAGYVGTFPLPEAQMDRFMMRMSMGYPTVEEETQIMRDRLSVNPVRNVRQVMSAEQLYGCIAESEKVNVADSICKYIAQLSAATREHPFVSLGASPRASVAMMQASRTFAYLCGRNYVVPDDITELIEPVFSHRIVLKQEARLKKIQVKQVLEEVVKSVTPPINK